jgi:hypothetical protein
MRWSIIILSQRTRSGAKIAKLQFDDTGLKNRLAIQQSVFAFFASLCLLCGKKRSGNHEKNLKDGELFTGELKPIFNRLQVLEYTGLYKCSTNR